MEQETQLTAVEFLLNLNVGVYESGKDVKLSDVLDVNQIQQAKEMEEQEKIDFADKYGTYLLQGGIMSAAAYNETFKSE